MHLSLSGRARRSVSLALLSTVAATIVLAGPVAAATPPTSDYGNTATCRYAAPGDGPAFNWRIKKIVVTAPVLYAKSGTQNVGWRFVVTRSESFGGDPWTVTYRSPIQKASATTSQAAPFTTKTVDVAIPKVENITSVWYHVALKLYWYRSNGSVQSQTTYLMPYVVSHTRFDDDWDNHCQAGFYQGP
jgi:hypothetical protein